MTNLLDKLEQAAEKATPGIWVTGRITMGSQHHFDIHHAESKAFIACTGVEEDSRVDVAANANYIVLANPENIKKVCEAAKIAIDELSRELPSYQKSQALHRIFSLLEELE